MKDEKIKVVIFGAGMRAKEFLERGEIFEIAAAYDNDPNKWGKDMSGIPILPPSELGRMESEYIVVTTAFPDIFRQIAEQFPYLTEKIWSMDRMLELQFVILQCRKLAPEHNRSQYPLLYKKIAVYTGIFGNYDELKEPLATEENVDYICYTDNRQLKSDKWEIRYAECGQDNMAIEVRKYKCLPHRFLGQYDISLWIDANQQIIAPLKPMIEEYMGESGILFFPHPQRDCIYEEGAVCLLWHRENTKRIINQMYEYSEDNFPEHYGLFWGGCIVREHNRGSIIKCMEDWYKEVLNGSARDQISLPYVLRKNNIRPDLCGAHCDCNRWFRYFPHLK